MLSTYLRRDFPSLGIYRSYLNTAYVGLMPRIVREEGVRSLVEYVSDPLGKRLAALDKYNDLRRRLSWIIQWPSESLVTVMSGTTSCIARMTASILASLSRERGERIPVALTRHEFPGVIHAVRSLCSTLRSYCSGTYLIGERGKPDWEEKAIEFQEETGGIVIASSVQWDTGYLGDIGRVQKYAVKNDGFMIVDVAQHAGQLTVDGARNRLDVVCGTFKKWLLAPIAGIGYGAFSQRIVDRVEPYFYTLYNLEFEEEQYCDPSDSLLGKLPFRSDAEKFTSVGRPSLFSIEIASLVLEYLSEISQPAIRDHILGLRKIAEDLIVDSGFNYVLNGYSYERKSGIILVDIGKSPSETLKICRLLQKRGISVSCRGQSGIHGIRVSFHIYNDSSDLILFLEDLKRLVSRA